MDIQSLSDGLALFRSGMDGVRSALGTWRDIRGLLPDDKAGEIDRALETSEEQLRIAEAQIAKGLGYTLCHCLFPPTPMLTVGWKSARGPANPGGPVHRCSKCGITDNNGTTWAPTAILADRAADRLSGGQEP